MTFSPRTRWWAVVLVAAFCSLLIFPGTLFGRAVITSPAATFKQALLSGQAAIPGQALEETALEETAIANERATIAIDGRVLFQVGGTESFSAEQRANIVNAQLDNTLASTPPDVPINLHTQTRGDLTTIWIDNRLLLTMTDGDIMVGDAPMATAREWVAILEQTLAQAQVERTPTYRRRALVSCIGLIGLAIALHSGQRWLYRQLRRQITQQPTSNQGWLNHWAIRLLLQPALAYGRLVVGLGALFYFTGLFSWSRYWRHRLLRFLQRTFTTPVFTLGDQHYSILDMLQAVILVVGLWLFVRAITALVRSRFLRKVGASREVQDAIALTLQISLTGLGLILVLSGLGFDLSSLAIFASVLGVGIGFGLQNIANNFMSGLVILLERPIRVGDFVKLGDLTGTVERIGARSTEIQTLDLVTIIVPNSELVESKVINWSHGHPVSRLHIPFGVAYGTTIRTLQTAVIEAVLVHPEVLRYPQPQIRFDSLGDSALNFDILVWIRDPRQQFRIKSDLYYLLEANLRRHHIDIPFPQRDINLRSPYSPTEAAQLFSTVIPPSSAVTPSPAITPPETANKDVDPATLLSDLLEYSTLVRQRGDLSDDELGELVAQLRGSDGVSIGDRRYGLSMYSKCFIGSDAVVWLMQHQKATRDEALRIGQQLIERGLMHHVTDEHCFQDEYLFYRFYVDEALMP